MDPSYLTSELISWWQSINATRDRVLAEAETMEEAVSMAVDEYLHETEALMGGDVEPWDA